MTRRWRVRPADRPAGRQMPAKLTEDVYKRQILINAIVQLAGNATIVGLVLTLSLIHI